MYRYLKIQARLTCSVVGATILLGYICLLDNFVFSDSVYNTLNINIPNSCSMSSSVSNSNENLYNINIAGGNVQTNIGSTEFTAICNDSNGYSIYVIGYGGETNGNTKLIAESPLSDTYDINTGVVDSGDSSGWSMRLESSISGISIASGYDSYSVIPETFTKVVSNASNIYTGSSIVATAKYQVYISTDQPAGTYTGKVKYVLVYSGMTNPPVGYKANGNTLEEVFDGITTMQAMTTSICTNAAVGDTKQLKDTRDNKYYWVTKLADNKCWMTQNLDLDLSSSVTLTPSDTNITDNWTPASTAKTVVTDNLNSSNWSASYDNAQPYSFDGGDAYLPNGKLSSVCSNKDITTCPGAGALSLTDTTTVLGNTNAHYHVGNHYTWTAAIASNDSSSYTTSYENVPSSICPKGWKLPSVYYMDDGIRVNSDFKELNDAYGGKNSDSVLRSAPLYFVRSGIVDSSILLYAVGAAFGEYWSSTVNRGYYAYGLLFDSSSVHPIASNRNHADGLSIRCIAK